MPDIVGHDVDFCNIMHADTAGTKTALAYIYWKETGDASVWRGIAQDAIIMNVDDMICIGSFDPIVISSTIGRNKHLITEEVIGEVIFGAEDVFLSLREQGLDIVSAGGETADVGDIVRTIDVGYTAFSRTARKNILEIDIQPGQQIVGLASFGQTSYEQSYNSGIGSNGLTSARHDTLSSYYRDNYPEIYAPQTDREFVYTGDYRITDEVRIGGEAYSIKSLLLSPTRTYFPVLKNMMEFHRSRIHGIVHCTGGAQTKVLKFNPNGSIIKNNLFTPPPVFQLIKNVSGASWKEMYQVFNMGHRMELYVDPEIAIELVAIAESFNLYADVIGEVTDKEEFNLRISCPDDQTVDF